MNYDFVNVCREELKLCGVHEGEAVAILSSDAPDELLGHAGAFMQAAKELGALPYHVRVPEELPLGVRAQDGDRLALVDAA